MLRWRLLLFDLVHHSGASAVVRETDYGCFSMPIWKSNHADSCIPWSSRPVSSAAVLMKEVIANAMAASVYDSSVREGVQSNKSQGCESSSARSSGDQTSRLQLDGEKW